MSSFNPSTVRILNNLVTRLNQRQNESSGFDGGDVTKNINMKNESGVVLYDSDDEDKIILRAPEECDNYTLFFPDSISGENRPLIVQGIDTTDPDNTKVTTTFGNNVTISSLETQSISASVGQNLFIEPSTNLLVYNGGNENRMLTLAGGDPENDFRFSMFESSVRYQESLGAGTSFNVSGSDVAANSHYFIKHTGCSLSLPTDAGVFDSNYSGNVAGGAGVPAINNRYSIKIITDGANSCQLNMNAPTGFTPFNLTFPYTVPAASIATLTFIKRTAAPTYIVFVELSTLIP